MPELRQNLATREWVIIASERARRPNAYVEERTTPLHTELPHYDAACPFCPGNEELDLEVTRHPLSGPWQTRVVRNKYPALAREGQLLRSFDGVQRQITGVGYHEVLVEHPQHNTSMALMAESDVCAVFDTFRERGLAVSRDPRIEQIVYFKNHGVRAGASLQHPHSQVIALPIVPGEIRHRMEEARRFFDDTGECVFCRMLHDELALGERVVAANEHFVAFVLYAASSPFHAWILPHRHFSSFRVIGDEEISSLAAIVRDVLRRIFYGLNDPAYNLVVRTSPVKEGDSVYFHAYMAVIPRLSRHAGFELGSGVSINPTIPEACAAFLREVAIP
jgi:UDPglucose--hexose-1-phosphate uridylyltransferase